MNRPVSLVRVIRADYANPVHGRALVAVLDAYASDPMGGGEALSDFSRTHVVASLAARPHIFSVLAFIGENENDVNNAVGLVNCIEGFSTFACRPLVNIHDLVVLPGYRGQGIGAQMLVVVEEIARQRGACKLTLEVLEGNGGAQRLYQKVGFAPYALDPVMGSAQFLQKWLG